MVFGGALRLVSARSSRARLLTTIVITLALAGASAGHAAAQTRVPARTLGPKLAEGSELFSQVRGFRELSDGRVLITDQTEQKIVLLDMARNTATRLGRQGAGPGEYGRVTDLKGLPGDTTLLLDLSRGLNAYTAITPDGRLGARVELPPGVQNSFMFGVDRLGRIYMPASTSAALGTSRQDSVALIRVDMRLASVDTLLFLRTPKRAPVVPPNHYNPRDQWAVGLDGTIAVVHVDDYHVTWVAPDGKRRVGPKLPYERIAVTQQDQDEFATLARRTQGLGVSSGGMNAATGRIETAFPDFKPPFFGNDAVRIAPNGELWVRRSQPAAEKRPLHDILDTEGKVLATISLPADTKLLSLGTHGIYLARWDQDDLIHVERYAYPR